MPRIEPMLTVITIMKIEIAVISSMSVKPLCIFLFASLILLDRDLTALIDHNRAGQTALALEVNPHSSHIRRVVLRATAVKKYYLGLGLRPHEAYIDPFRRT